MGGGREIETAEGNEKDITKEVKKERKKTLERERDSE